MEKSVKKVISEKFGAQIAAVEKLYKGIARRIKTNNYNLSYNGTPMIYFEIDIDGNNYEVEFVVKKDTDKRHGRIYDNGDMTIYATKAEFIEIQNNNIPDNIENALKHELSHLYDMVKNVSFEDENKYKPSTRKKFKDKDLQYFFSRSEVYADLSTAISKVINFFSADQLEEMLASDFAGMVYDEYEKNIVKMGGSYVSRNIPQALKNYILKRAVTYFEGRKSAEK